MYKRKGNSRTRVAPTLWSALPLVESNRRLNRRCVELLATTAHRRGADASPAFARADLWARLDERSIERAARCPVLLLSLQFDHPEWWQRVMAGRGGPVILNAPPPFFTTEEVGPLLRSMLTEAWSAARSNVFAASVLFGMTPGVARVLTMLTVPKIDEIVMTQAGAVRPRWEDQRSFWSGLLEAAVTEDPEPVTRVHLHALQLLGSNEAIHRV